MRARMLYLARPIDQTNWRSGDDERITRWVQEAETAAGAASLALVRPERIFTVPVGMHAGPEIRDILDAALLRCDGLVALAPRGVPSWGVPTEVEMARANGQPVAVVTDMGETSWAMSTEGVELFADAAAAVRWVVAQVGMAADKERAWSQATLRCAVTGNGRLPVRAHPDDAGFDLYVSQDAKVPPGEFVDIECDVRVELPEGVWGLLTGRSSTLRRRGLFVSQAVIDTGYRGKLFAGVMNMGSSPVVVEAGERLAQLILLPALSPHYTPIGVSELRPSARGESGFGSTGS